MKKIQGLGRSLNKNEQRLIVGASMPDDEDEMVPKTSCSCIKADGTGVGPHLCSCGYEAACAKRKCGSDNNGWACASC